MYTDVMDKAHIHMTTDPTIKQAWQQHASKRGLDLTAVITVAMEREIADWNREHPAEPQP